MTDGASGPPLPLVPGWAGHVSRPITRTPALLGALLLSSTKQAPPCFTSKNQTDRALSAWRAIDQRAFSVSLIDSEIPSAWPASPLCAPRGLGRASAGSSDAS